jgi:hypothetical protein
MSVKLGLIQERGYQLSHVYGYGYRLDQIKTNDDNAQTSESREDYHPT